MPPIRPRKGGSIRLPFEGYVDLDPPARIVNRGTLAPGTYRVVHYVIDRGRWLLSCSGDGPVFTVEAGTEMTIPIGTGLRLECEVLSVALTGHDGMEATLIDGDRRSPASYVVLDAGGRELARGSLRFG